MNKTYFFDELVKKKKRSYLNFGSVVISFQSFSESWWFKAKSVKMSRVHLNQRRRRFNTSVLISILFVSYAHIQFCTKVQCGVI